MTNVEIFAEIIRDNYYFSPEKINNPNRWEWDDEVRDHIVIWNDDSFSVKGLDCIGAAAASLDLCCNARWNEWKERVEVHVH